MNWLEADSAEFHGTAPKTEGETSTTKRCCFAAWLAFALAFKIEHAFMVREQKESVHHSRYSKCLLKARV
jgi:hypothetical protein